MELQWQHDKIWRAQPAPIIGLNDIFITVCHCCCSMSPSILIARIAGQKGTASFIHVGNFQGKVITFHKFSVVGVHSLLLEGVPKLEVVQLVFLHC